MNKFESLYFVMARLALDFLCRRLGLCLELADAGRAQLMGFRAIALNSLLRICTAPETGEAEQGCEASGEGWVLDKELTLNLIGR